VPDPRLQRTPSVPLTRRPLGGRTLLVSAITAVMIACGTDSVSVGRPVAIRPTTVVKVTGAFHMDSPKGPSAVVILYETKIDIRDFAAFAAEADELMKFWQADVEADRVAAAVLRASHDGNGYGFGYERHADGTWVRKAN
jgi:hypothetical protein